jgi:hypothetical protein
MTPASSALQPDSNPALYVSTVLTLFIDLPDTSLRAGIADQRQARLWFDRAIPLHVVETALVLATLRRLTRPTGASPLPRIRSLAYFQPVVDELLQNPVPDGYLPYLRRKLRGLLDNADPAQSSKIYVFR